MHSPINEMTEQKGPPTALPLRVGLACDAAGREAASSLVNQVYGAMLGLRPPKGHAAEPASLTQTLVLVAQRGDRLVATLTLASAGFCPGESPCPYEAESLFCLESLGLSRERVAEVRRVAALPNQRDAVLALYAFTRELCLTHGIHSLLGLVEAGSEVDVISVLRAAYEARLTEHPLPLLPLYDEPLARALRDEIAPFGAEDRGRPAALPKRLGRFAADLGARVVGVPVRHPVYPRIVIPMLADLRLLTLTSAQT